MVLRDTRLTCMCGVNQHDCTQPPCSLLPLPPALSPCDTLPLCLTAALQRIMGGALFTKAVDGQPALHCPRMPTPVYHDMKHRCAIVLTKFFARALTPAEGPGKPDHGDVDFNVAGAANGNTGSMDRATFSSLIGPIAATLNATRHQQRGPDNISFAVPWRESPSQNSATHPSVSPDEPHAQIDVALCESDAQLEWLTWLHSYSDLSQILALSLRPLALILHPHGFLLRDPGMAGLGVKSPVRETPSRKSLSDLVLSTDCSAVMRFLELDIGRYQAGLDTEEALFCWIAQCRFLSRDVYLSRRTCAQEGAKQDADTMGSESQQAGAATVNGNSYVRASQMRHTLRHFANEFIPAHPDVGANPPPSPESAMDEASAFFGKTAERAERYAFMEAEDREATFWVNVKTMIPLERNLKVREVMRALRRWTSVEQSDSGWRLGIRTSPVLDEASIPSWTAASGWSDGKLLEWVEENWKQCYELEHTRTKQAKASRQEARQRGEAA